MNKFLTLLIKRRTLILLGFTVISYFILVSNDGSKALNCLIIIPLIFSVYVAPYFFDGKDYRPQSFHCMMLYVFMISTFGKFIDSFIVTGLMINIMLNIVLSIALLLSYYFRIKYFDISKI